ncbi:MAG: DUF5610 domain-containing protein [Azoarcus sp.]|jgi:hypothetical protein|nr:DUF5610 domain-containing protein [Azoarcus sp.]
MSAATPVSPSASIAVQPSQEKPEAGRVSHTTAIKQARQQVNVQILEASAKTSLSAGSQSQALVFRSAIDRINELLAPEFGSDALQGFAASQDNSAEATAQRILDISTGFYEGYARQHPGEDPEELARKFVDLVRGGFEKGFGEARKILEGLNVFSGDVKDGVMKTYDLVHKGYDDFLSGKLAAIQQDKIEP